MATSFGHVNIGRASKRNLKQPWLWSGRNPGARKGDQSPVLTLHKRYRGNELIKRPKGGGFKLVSKLPYLADVSKGRVLWWSRRRDSNT